MAMAKTWKQHSLLLPVKRLIKRPPRIPPKGSDPAGLGMTTKVRYKVAYDHRPILTQWADKVGVRDYVAEKVGAKYLNELYAVSSSAASIDFTQLPRDFSFKPSHGSGAGIFVHEDADPNNSLPANAENIVWEDKFHIHPDKVDFEALKNIGAHWLTMRYENYHSWFEWAYKDVEAKLLVEKYLTDPSGLPPTNCGIYTFHGVPKYMIIYNVFSGFRVIVTPEWEYISVPKSKWHLDPREQMPQKPENLQELLEVAATLSGGIDFVRVDLYNLGSKITFGEMTNYPGGGRTPKYSEEFEALSGSYWKHFDEY